MQLVNNFKYGEISRRLAGSFDKETYQQGVFGYRNMITDSFGCASRRPPIKKIIETTGLLDIREFKISETIQYLVGLSQKQYYVYRYVLGDLEEIAHGLYPHRSDESEITLDKNTAREIRSAQYYERLYFVHSSFRPFYIEAVSSADTFNASHMEVILNQDAKKTFYFTPSYVTDEEGTELKNMESRLVYRKEAPDGSVTWWFDYNMEEDEYEYSEFYPPVLGESSNISYFEDYKDDTLLTGKGHYPSVIAIINDSMYLAATDNEPSTIWKSRILGTSQYIEGYTAESMHDFSQFQMISTEQKDIVDEEDLPKTEMTDSYGDVIYEENIYGVRYFVPDKDADGNYTYETELFWKVDEDDSENLLFYYNRDGNDFSMPYTWTDDADRPVKKPIMTYDLSNPDALMKTSVKVSLVATDSCGARFSLNTGRNDRIIFISPALSKIIVGTSRSEHMLPSTFSATNMSQDNYSYYGSLENYMLEPSSTDGSFIFFKKGGALIEFYNYQGYIYSQDVSYLNHDILKGNPIQLISKNYPAMHLYILYGDGNLVMLSYDKNNGVQAFSKWDFPTRKILSLAEYSSGTDEIMLSLVEEDDGTQWIGYFDESETKSFYDEGDVEYLSEIETTYAEVIDGQYMAFGYFKKANRAYIRPYDTGRVYIGDDKRQLVLSNYELGSEDYAYSLLGSSRRQYSMFIQSYKGDPMTILAFAFEVGNGQ